MLSYGRLQVYIFYLILSNITNLENTYFYAFPPWNLEIEIYIKIEYLFKNIYKKEQQIIIRLIKCNIKLALGPRPT